MADKPWTYAIGDLQTGVLPDSDDLLKSKQSEKKRRDIEREEEEQDAKHRARMANLAKETKAATAEAGKVDDKADSGPFKMKGEINLGSIDIQKNQEVLSAEINRLRLEAEASAQQTGQENMRLRDMIHEKEMEHTRNLFTMQMATMQKMIEDGNSNKKSFGALYQEAVETANILGMGRVSPETTDMTMQIELKKLDFTNTLELKKMAREEKRADRQFQLDLKKFDDDRIFRQAEAQRSAERDKIFTSLPDMLGRVIAQGYMERGADGEAAAAGGVKKKGYRLEAGMGETGVIDCPGCKQEGTVAIAPTSDKAVCGSCGANFIISRTQRPIEEEEE